MNKKLSEMSISYKDLAPNYFK